MEANLRVGEQIAAMGARVVDSWARSGVAARGGTRSRPTYAETDREQILVLYDALLAVWSSPVVALNRAVVVAMVDGPTTALAARPGAPARPFDYP
ncbi:hypothetical protein [Streptomyces sp. NBC_01716]|uniref:hypothetical protein n=1 Tax=Streptomyces sp. NBC_01716 TaxID=2975917 RepID=UPI002E35E933|nr:hypothetical protein [Streptomyces sp. NBC_01716]